MSRPALEKIGIVRGRLIHQHQQDFAANVHTFVVVPLILGGFNAVSHVNDLGVNVIGWPLGLVISDVLIERLKLHGISLGGREFEGGLGRWSDSDHRHFLEESSVVAGRLQSVEPELSRNIFRGNVSATLAGTSALKKIVREEAHVRPDALRLNLLQSGNRDAWKMR